MSAGEVRIAPESPDSAEARALLAASDAYMASLYPPEDNYLLDVAALLAPEITFIVARRDGAAVGCAAIARRAGYVEVKRMWVEPAARGLRVGRRLLDTLESLARKEGHPAMMLEAGVSQPEALGLYSSAGFTERGPFGDYPEGHFSVFMEKRL